MSKFMIPRLEALEAYVPGEQPKDKKYIKLNTNESPYPPSPSVIDAVTRAELEDMRLYSDPECAALKAALAREYGVKPENVFVSNGSDETLSLFFAAYCGNEVPVFCPEISYGFYPVYARYYGAPYNAVPMEDDLSINYRRFLGVDGNVVLANPNAPTGIALPVSQLREIAESIPEHMLCVDEAYVDFGAESALPLIRDLPNVLIVQTYSKSRSMAGARLGFAFGQPEVIADLEKLKYSFNPYNVNRVTKICGEAALKDGAYFRDCCAKIMREREYLSEALKALGGELTPSLANFVFVRFPGFDGAEICAELKARGVLIRRFNVPRIKDWLRITVGSRSECETLVAELKEILGGAK